jgi:hypothetical protein
VGGAVLRRLSVKEIPGGWNKAGIIEAFEIDPKLLKGMEILYAAYECDGYECDAMVLYRDRAGHYFEVYGSHCSCYGLEDQWEPEETTLASLKLRAERGAFKGTYSVTSWDVLIRLVKRLRKGV